MVSVGSFHSQKRLNTGRKGGVAEASRIDRENRYLKISRMFGTGTSQGSSNQETEARYDEVGGRTKGLTEKE